MCKQVCVCVFVCALSDTWWGARCLANIVCLFDTMDVAKVIPTTHHNDLYVPASHYLHHTTSITLPTWPYQHHTTCITLPASHYLHNTTCITLPASHYLHHTTCITLPTSHYQHHTTNITLPASHYRHHTTGITLPASHYRHHTTCITPILDPSAWKSSPAFHPIQCTSLSFTDNGKWYLTFILSPAF
jgi:hypothetical protein